jgi:hypothetical protein
VLLEALAAEPGSQALSVGYRRAHNLSAASTVQRALEALIDDELVSRFADGYRIAEPFLAEWIISGAFQGVTADHPPRPSSCRGATGR